MDDSRTEIAIAIVEQSDQFLVGRRPPNVPLAGLYEFPGGKVEPHENAEQAVIRECLEEAGVCVEVIERLDVREHDYDHGKLKLHFFSCRPTNRSSKPTGSFRWVRRDELRGLQFPEANRPIIKQLTARLESRSDSTVSQ